MAQIIEDFTPRGRGLDKYDWDTILNGDIWRLLRDDDYDVKDSTVRTMAYTAASKRGLRVHTKVPHEGCVEVQAYRPDSAEE
jgi:hypothetical protein